MVNLIIKDMDMDECGQHATEDFGVFGLFDLVRVSICRFASFFCPLYFLLYYNRCPLQAMVRMKALQARCEAKEGVVRHQRTLLEYEADQLNQYKEDACILNDKWTRKKVVLETTSLRCKELAKANTNLTTELAALREQIEQAKADSVAEYQTSQPFYDELGGLYDDGFEDCLKQVVALYLNLDLSRVVIDDSVLLMPGSADNVLSEADDIVHLVEGKVKEPAQAETNSLSVPEGQTVTVDLSILEGLLASEGQSIPDASPSQFYLFPFLSFIFVFCKNNFKTMECPVLGLCINFYP